MKTVYKVLAGSFVSALLTSVYSYYLNGPVILTIVPVFLVIFPLSVTGFYWSLSWFVRSIKRDLDRQEQQKSKQKKQQ